MWSALKPSQVRTRHHLSACFFCSFPWIVLPYWCFYLFYFVVVLEIGCRALLTLGESSIPLFLSCSALLLTSFVTNTVLEPKEVLPLSVTHHGYLEVLLLLVRHHGHSMVLPLSVRHCILLGTMLVQQITILIRAQSLQSYTRLGFRISFSP